MTDLQLPGTCIPDLSVSFDTNQDWPCKRAAFIAMLHSRAAEIVRTEAWAQRRSAYERRNVARWAADARQRLAALIPLTDDRACTCWQSGLYGERPSGGAS